MAGKDNIEKPAELAPFKQTVALKALWSVDFADASGLRFALRPATDGRVAYAAGRDGRVRAVELETGRPVWRTDLDATLSAGPGLGEGLVVVAGADAELVALNATDGTVRWRTRVSSEVLATPEISRNIVAVRTTDGALHGLDATDGAILWTHRQSLPALVLRGSSAPVVNDGTVITGFPNGKVTGNLLRDGHLVWETAVGSPTGRTEIERMSDIVATPRVIGRDVYAVGYQGRLVAMALESGRILWSSEISSSAGLDAATLGVWVTDENSEVVAFDRLSGQERWRQDALRARWLTAPTAIRDVIAVGDLEGWLHLMSQESGELVARIRVDSEAIGVAPVAIRDVLLVQSDGGRVTAYRVGE